MATTLRARLGAPRFWVHCSLGSCACILIAGCSLSVDVDGFTFPAAGAGAAGTGGNTPSAGAGGNGGGGLGGTGTLDEPDAATLSAGNGVSTEPGNASGPDAGNDDGGDALDCAPSDRCVPEVPVGWQGPLAVGANGAATCPDNYPTPLGQVNTDFQAGAATCDCGCVPSGVSCHLLSTAGTFFAPADSCDTPPVADDCLTVVAEAFCTPSPLVDIRVSQFATTELTCGDGVPAGACAGGTCYRPPADGFGALCISKLGDEACPAGFPSRTLYFQSISDDRACSTCACTAVGQNCQMNLEICSVGFFQVTLNDGEVQCLNSSDGDGVTLLSQNITGGSCVESGGVLQGTTAPATPNTVCCLE